MFSLGREIVIMRKFVGFLVVWVVVVFGWSSGASAGLIDLQWASSISDVSHSNFYADPANALGKPDGLGAGFFDSTAAIESATYGAFGAGEESAFDSSALSGFLGVSESLLLDADFIAFEFNGTSGDSFETGEWEFSDGTSSVVVSHVVNTPPSGAISSLGNISQSAYDTFFSLGDYPPLSPIGEWTFILFDIDGNSSVNPYTVNFSAKLSTDGVAVLATPDPDAMARLGAIPEPSTALLLGIGLSALAATRRRAS